MSDIIRGWKAGWSRAVVCGLTLLLHTNGWAQLAPNRYLIYFTDKDNTPYSLDEAGEFLSDRALQRRVNQGVAVEWEDLPVDPDYLAGLGALSGVEVLYPLKWMNAAVIHCTDENQLTTIASLPFVSMVKSATPGTGGKQKKLLEPESVIGAKNLTAGEYGAAWEQISQINLQHLHNQGYRGEDVLIAVTDGGFNLADTDETFDALRNENRIAAERDFTLPQQGVYNYSMHGTYVASIIGGNTPGNIVGAAYEATFALLATEEVQSEYPVEELNWCAAAEFADSLGADIINISLNYTRFDNELGNYQYAEDLDGQTTYIAQGVNRAFDRGMLVVVSAGNYRQQPWFHIGSPADAPGALTVGAVDSLGVAGSFSSIGPSADGRTKPDIAAMGVQSAITTGVDSVFRGNGTSFSAPLISGAAACLWQKYPIATAAQLREAIVRSAHQYTSPDDTLGHGIPNFARADSLLAQTLSVPLLDGQNRRAVVYPNPASDFIHILQSDALAGEWKIYDLQGRWVQTADMQAVANLMRVNISGLADGVYFLQPPGNQRQEAVRFVKTTP